ncbi:hypothetical protein ACIPSE_04145 [Streptomyces sp. NPDC090106]|uniref:hypothetical protein n=1 Tax=Streptomyces sp. NPDC090106 TaxID=3365946 RepID=UPI00382282D7
MPTFRQPEWQQNADRHTELIDPVLTVRQLSRFEFNLRSYVRIDHALVFATAKGGYEPYLPPRRPTRGDIATNRYTAVYEVDMGVHPHTCELPLPSDNDAFEFTAQVDLSWQVVDPARFVASGHRDVPALLLGELQQAARPVTRRFAIGDSAAAEREMLEAMNLLGPLGAPAGLQVTWTVRLRRDQENIDHQRRLQAIDHSAEEQIRVARRGMDVDAEADLRGRGQDALQLDRAMAYGAQQQALLLQQQRWQHEQAMLQGRQMLELQQIEAEKIAFYQWHLQQGGVHGWALHLAQHPEDSRMVMQSMRDDQLRMIQSQMGLVKELLGGEAAENWELEGPKQLALRTVHDILNQRMPGVPQQSLPEADGTPLPDQSPDRPAPPTVQGQVLPGSRPPEPTHTPGTPHPTPTDIPNPYGMPAQPHPAPFGTPSRPYPTPNGMPAQPYPGPTGTPGHPHPGPTGTPGQTPTAPVGTPAQPHPGVGGAAAQPHTGPFDPTGRPYPTPGDGAPAQPYSTPGPGPGQPYAAPSGRAPAQPHAEPDRAATQPHTGVGGAAAQPYARTANPPGQPFTTSSGVPGGPHTGTAGAPAQPHTGPLDPTGRPYPTPGDGAPAQPYSTPTPGPGPGPGQPYPAGGPGPSYGPYGTQAQETPLWQPPTPHAPPPGAQAPYPGVPAPYQDSRPPTPAAPGPQAPTPGASPWQPPPGYGRTPTLPGTDVADSATDPEAGSEASGP